MAKSEFQDLLDIDKKVQDQSVAIIVGFHEKLSAITVGSLALAVTGAGVFYQKPLVAASMTHLAPIFLAVAVVCLWCSLVGSILHNFLECAAVREEAKAHKAESLTSEFRIAGDRIAEQKNGILETKDVEIREAGKDIVATEDKQPTTTEKLEQEIVEDIRRLGGEGKKLGSEIDKAVLVAVEANARETVNQEVAEKQRPVSSRYQRATKFRALELPASLAAVSFFVLGAC